MKIGENDSAHELAKISQAYSKFGFILHFYFDDLHLQIIESISPKASVENSSVQWAIFPKKIIHKCNIWAGGQMHRTVITRHGP